MQKNKEEQKIQKSILNFLRKNGCIAAKFNNIGIYATPGFPDVIGCTKQGIFIGIEVKVPGEKPTAIQQAYLDAINKAGGVGIHAVCVEDVKNALQKRKLL